LHVAEVLSHGQRGKRDPQPGTGRLVHLAEDQRGIVDDAGIGHLKEQVIALAGALAHPGEAGDPAEVLGHPADHLLDQHRLAHAGPAEQPDLPPRTYGVSRSMTLMPVVNISVLGSSWSSGGGSR